MWISHADPVPFHLFLIMDSGEATITVCTRKGETAKDPGCLNSVSVIRQKDLTELLALSAFKGRKAKKVTFELVQNSGNIWGLPVDIEPMSFEYMIALHMFICAWKESMMA